MLIIYYELIINAIAFIMYGLDKLWAIKGWSRVPEIRLIAIAAIGGAFGAWLGMKLFHHKTLKPKFRIVPVLLIIQIILAGFCLYQNLHIVVSEYSYTADKPVENCRVVQISDLHNQFFGLRQEYLLKKIRECKPDIIAVTGDAVDSNHTNYYLARQFFKGAVEIAPVYYVTGNHELWLESRYAPTPYPTTGENKYRQYIDDLKNMGVIFADNAAFDIKGMQLAGLADNSLGDSTLSGLLRHDGTMSLVLAHEPAYYQDYVKDGADLVLTGHVHGGQFIIPNKGGLISPDFEFFPELYEGKHKFGYTTMIISRGLGNSIVPLRLNNYPEIVVVNIESKN